MPPRLWLASSLIDDRLRVVKDGYRRVDTFVFRESFAVRHGGRVEAVLVRKNFLNESAVTAVVALIRAVVFPFVAVAAIGSWRWR